ncbi:hypothetical protein AVEN_29322-1 [Araneus ventricosus]|uniref:Uncharacterized protein n=1 Tax=Araneus ventricosus TaxID=182803 RepID=A0A4Y2IXG2_ARAVE|nr:hypothetical protein AVEN_29322-1 [Araneus ventricosus]
MITRYDKRANSYSQSLEEIVQEEVEKALANVAVKQWNLDNEKHMPSQQKNPLFLFIAHQLSLGKRMYGEQLATAQFVSSVDVLGTSCAIAERIPPTELQRSKP